MGIEVSDSDYVSSYILNSKSCVNSAIAALTIAKTTFILAGDSASANVYSTIVEKLSTQKTKLSNVSDEFINTKSMLNSADRNNITTYDDASGSIKNVGTGVGIGVLSSVAGHTASSFTTNALKTALYRKGASKLHGFAFEVMFADKLNNGLGHRLFTKAIVDGSNKPGSDVIVTRFGKVIGQYELKATGSKYYAQKALSKADSVYANSTIVFTDEMASEVGGNAGGYTLAATKNTATVAKTVSKTTLALKSIGRSAAASGIVGAVVDGGVEAVTKFSSWKNGEITGKQYLSGIGKETAIGGAAGVITGAALAGAAVAGITLTGGTALVVGAIIGGVANWGLHKLFG